MLSLKSFDLLILKINLFSLTRQESPQPSTRHQWQSHREGLPRHRDLRGLPRHALRLRHDRLHRGQEEAEEGPDAEGAVPTNTMIIFAIGGIKYSTDYIPWSWLASKEAAEAMAVEVATWPDK